MSYYRPSPNDESDRSRDPRQRDRSRSEIRRPNTTDTFPSSSLTTNQPLGQEQLPSTNSVLDFFKTLGLNSQLIQALINANPPKLEQIQQQPQQLVNNAQEFASFLSQSYGLNSIVIPPSNQPVNRDPRRRQISTVTTTPPISTDIPSKLDQPSDTRSVVHTNSMVNSNNLLNVSNNSTSSISIDESYKQFLCSIDQSLLDDETRQRFQRIALLDNELDKLYHMNIELIKNSEKRSRRRRSTKDKDPLLKENENLQNELIDYIKTLKTTMINNYSTYMFSNNMIITRQ